MKTKLLLITSLISLPFTPLAHSGEPDAFEALTPAPTQADNSWQFEVGLYGFLSGIDGTVESGGHTVDSQFKFEDIFKKLDVAFMLSASATYKNKFTLLTDFQYIALSGEDSLKGPLHDHGELDLNQTIFTLIGAWRVVNCAEGFVEVGGGFRYLYMDMNMEVSDSSGVHPKVKNSSQSNIVDGIVAIRTHYQLSPKWGLRLYGDVGTGDSDLTWQVYAGLGYALKENTSLFLGYRHMAYEMSDGGVHVDMALTGPQIGAVIRF